MKEWNKLSMAEKADIMKLAIQGGVYDLDAIRNGYNKFAEGGEVANEIPMDYQPLVSNTYQPIVDALKTDNTGFNIDDYTYRVQKLHPEITRDQVQSLYNATPYIASDKVIGTQEGGFRPGDETGYGRRVTLYPNTYTQNTGTKVTSSNVNEAMGDTLAHETNHLYTDILLGGSNETEKDLLFDAYRPGFVVQDPRFNGDYSEERAINAQIRNRISRENGNVIGEELDKAIDNTPDDALMDMLFDSNNGYINQSGRKHMQDKNGNWNRTDAVRKALKDVALNQMAFPVENYAADGGKIHIKPENRGKFTRLKERTGHSASWFKEHGTPAQKKMAVFELNARKWKHAYGGELGNYYDGWGDAWNYLKRGVQKARQKVKDWGLDKDPIQHLASKVEDKYSTIIQNRNPELSGWITAALDAGRVLGINNTIKGEDDDIRYRQNLYNLIDPTNAIPESVGDVIDYAKVIKAAKSDKDYSYSRMYEDKAADAAWAKRLGLPYDTTILVDNPDGSVHLAKYLEDEIPTDTNSIKKRIADNEELMNKTYGPKRRDIRAALDVDNKALEALRETYRTGNKVEMNEFSHMSRDLRQNNQTSPLNLLHRYTLQYDKDNNVMNYSDIYNFDGFEDYVPGNPFDIRGRIELGKRTRK